MRISKFFILILPFLCAGVVSAHQPRLVESENVVIENPEVSQAFYGELVGEPAFYELESENPFDLYVAILVPDVPGVSKDVSAEISREGNGGFSVFLDGENFEWTEYYEEHAGDNYFSGPYFSDENKDELHPKGVRVSEGKYVIKVSNLSNQGKYVLVVGDTESFPLREIARTVTVMPGLKKYFEKSIFESFSTPTMVRFLLVVIVALVAMITLVWWIVKLIRRRLSA
ncbi:MAG: hypothetical protein OEV93_05075 [Candidatus Moranbacteria bacterium]|nr:hypothetical protein [Candidatus Moranbacteria bacterium]